MEEMLVKVNNREVNLEGEMTVGELLEKLGYDISYMTVFLNRDVLPRREYSSRIVRDGDEIVVTYIMSGG